MISSWHAATWESHTSCASLFMAEGNLAPLGIWRRSISGRREVGKVLVQHGADTESLPVQVEVHELGKALIYTFPYGDWVKKGSKAKPTLVELPLATVEKVDEDGREVVSTANTEAALLTYKVGATRSAARLHCSRVQTAEYFAGSRPHWRRKRRWNRR
jgi:hypothetical protein